jgi:DNA helicase HerA-like ATPase
MILSSQRAHDFHEDIRANAAAKLFLKSTEDKDLKYIRTQLDDDPGEKVANLNKFECFFKDDTHTPYIRLRITPYFERQDHE